MRRRNTRRHSRGLFFTFEGPEGSGKSTQIAHLARKLKRAGYDVVRTREPGGTVLAEAIRRVLLLSSSRERMTPVAETLLILAARSQHVAHVIEPALRSGAIVLCDRFSYSTFAYQGFARGLPLDWLRSVNEVATQGRSPDLTLLLDLPVRLGLSRRQRARLNLNRLDRESERFHRHVRRGYLTLAAQTPRRTIIVDAARPEEKIRAEIETLVLGWLRNRRT